MTNYLKLVWIKCFVDKIELKGNNEDVSYFIKFIIKLVKVYRDHKICNEKCYAKICAKLVVYQIFNYWVQNK